MKLARAKLVVILLTVAGLLLTGGLVAFVTAPSLKELGVLGHKLVRAHAELESQYANRKKLATSVTDVQKSRESLAIFADQFVGPGDELSFITAVESIAAARGVSEQIRLVPGAAAGASEVTVGFELTLNGPYNRVMQAIVDMERMAALVIFQSFSLRPWRSPGASETSVTVSLKGAVAAPPRGL